MLRMFVFLVKVTILPEQPDHVRWHLDLAIEHHADMAIITKFKVLGDQVGRHPLELLGRYFVVHLCAETDCCFRAERTVRPKSGWPQLGPANSRETKPVAVRYRHALSGAAHPI